MRISGCLLLITASAMAAEPVTLTREAVRMALAQKHALKVARLEVVGNQQKKAQARSSYFPEITNRSTVSHTTELENIDSPTGALGVSSALMPNRDIVIGQGSHNLVTSGPWWRNHSSRAKQMLRVAAEAVRPRTEGMPCRRSVDPGCRVGVRAPAGFRGRYKAQADLLQAQLAHLLARAELEQTIGWTRGAHTPRRVSGSRVAVLPQKPSIS